MKLDENRSITQKVKFPANLTLRSGNRLAGGSEPMGRRRKDMSENGNKRDGSKGVPNREGTQWQKGRSGNPGGRPRTAAFAQACREVLAAPAPDDAKGHNNAEAISWKLAEMARAGNVRAAVELADRAEGRARQSVETENTALTQWFERMTEAELLAYAESGALPDWFRTEADSARQQ
jgi:hypothetical protein